MMEISEKSKLPARSERSGFRGAVSLILAFIGLVSFVAVLITEIKAFNGFALELVKHGIKVRTEFISQRLEEPLKIGDMREVYKLGNRIKEKGGRLAVFTDQGGVFYDSAGLNGGDIPTYHSEDSALLHLANDLRIAPQDGFCYSGCSISGYRIFLSFPLAEIDHLTRKARRGYLVSAGAAAFGIIVIFLFTIQTFKRIHRLAAERDERGRRLAEMERAEKYRKEFISNLAHELRTPLSGIMASVEMLKGSVAFENEDDKALFKMLESETGRLNRLAEGILSLSRIEQIHEADTLRVERVNLNELLREIAARITHKAENVGIKLTFVQSEKDIVVDANAVMIDQMVTNLVENALRYSKADEIKIELGLSADFAIITIADNGIGIPKEHQQRIFERFYRVDNDRNSGLGGTGLGLAIVKHIAQLHGGSVSLVSDAGRGTTFRVFLGKEHKGEK